MNTALNEVQSELLYEQGIYFGLRDLSLSDNSIEYNETVNYGKHQIKCKISLFFKSTMTEGWCISAGSNKTIKEFYKSIK